MTRFLSSLLIILIAMTSGSLLVYYLHFLESLDFLAGALIASILWQVNYRVAFGRWFDY